MKGDKLPKQAAAVGVGAPAPNKPYLRGRPLAGLATGSQGRSREAGAARRALTAGRKSSPLPESGKCRG